MPETSPLPADVVATIEALLPPGTPGREHLLAQIPHTRLGKRCGCGCVTVDLVVDRSVAIAVPPDGQRNPAASASVTGQSDSNVSGVLLFTEDGFLACLEAYSVSDEPANAWPPAHCLELDDDA
jgi:hypothetical protein